MEGSGEAERGWRGRRRRRRRRCSRRMRGSGRETRLAQGTMLMRKPNQTLRRPSSEAVGRSNHQSDIANSDCPPLAFWCFSRKKRVPDTISVLEAGAAQ